VKKDARSRGRWADPLQPGVFPYADSEWLDQAPPCCPRPGCGGLWRSVD